MTNFTDLLDHQRQRYFDLVDCVADGDILTMMKHGGASRAADMVELAIKAWGDLPVVMYSTGYSRLMDVPVIKQFVLEGVMP